MISKILIIYPGGILCYSKTFVSEDKINDTFISGFLTAISDIAKEIGGGEIKKVIFRNFNFVYSYDDEKRCMFTIVTDIKDPEEEVNAKLELLKKEFMKRYYDDLKNWDFDTSRFESFDEFTEKNIFIPPKILLIGEIGVGKTTIMNLFSSETVIKLDDEMVEIVEKPIYLPIFREKNEIVLRELDMREIVENPKIYNSLLNAAAAICIITNSGGSNLGRTKRNLSIIQKRVKDVEFYIIANFQDLENISFSPKEVEKMFGIKTFGFSAIEEDAKKKIVEILIMIVNKTLVEKILDN
ncbi:MAG: hypothetical protein ACFE9Z_09885 [Promethearchaeota archaeon]